MRQPESGQNKGNQPRQVRLERRPKVQIAADDGQGWAVSYSDMLMVLMSFFVIFFSFEEDKRDSIISQIRVDLKAKAGATSGESTADEHQSSKASSPSNRVAAAKFQGKSNVAGLKDRLEGLNLEVTKSPEGDILIVHLSDQAYRMRRFDVSGQVRQELSQVLKVLRPFKNAIRITFVGHSDNVPLRSRSLYLTNNTDLSSLRASRAMSFAAANGFDTRQLSVEAAGANIRNTRSLSLKVLIQEQP